MAESSHADLVPRSNVVAAIVADTAKVVLVPGESGSGKSTVLSQAVAAVRDQRYVASIHEVMWTDPLAQILVRGLGEIVSEIAQQEGMVERVAARLAGAVERLIESKGRELVVAVGREIVGLIRSRLGPEAGKAIGDAVKALQEESAESLGARLDRARVETAREVIVGFIDEVVALADEHPVLFVLDRCERLDEAGVRLLADLADVLPAGAQIWAAVLSDSATGEFLSRTDASIVPLPPLTQDEVAYLLTAHDLPPAEAERLVGLTGGGFLEVRAYLGLLSTAQLPKGSSQETLVADTLRRVEALSDPSRALALRIAALSDPLPEKYMLGLTGGDAVLLTSAIAELDAVELLTVHGADRWIHEQQRAIILDGASGSERADAFADAAAAVWRYVVDGGDPQWFAELASLVAQAPKLAAEDDLVPAVLAADDGELGVLAALIELTEPATLAVEGQALLNYARMTYPTTGDELSALQRLEAANLVVVAQNDYAVAVALQLSGLALAVAIGRIGRVLGHLPVPAISSVAVRGVVLPRIAPFMDARFGIGRPSLQTLAYEAVGQVPAPFQPPPSLLSRINASPALLVRAAFAGRPLYGAFRFASAEHRDRALDALTNLDVEFLGERLAVLLTSRYPLSAVPADRFVRAAERIVGKHLQPTPHQGEIREQLATPLTYAESAELRVQTHQVLRELVGATMRGAMQLDLSLGLHWMERHDLYFEVEVHGGRAIARGHDQLPDVAFQPGPYQLFYLASALDLRPDESIARWTSTVGTREYARANYDPVLLEIGRRREHAIGFNRAQVPLAITFDDSLIDLIRGSFFREMADARALAARLPFLGRSDWQIPPTSRYVAIAREVPAPGWVPGARSTLIWAETLSENGQDQCHVIYVEGSPRDSALGPLAEASESALDSIPGFDRSTIRRGGQAVTMGGVAHLVGYREDDLDFLPGLRAHNAQGS